MLIAATALVCSAAKAGVVIDFNDYAAGTTITQINANIAGEFEFAEDSNSVKSDAALVGERSLFVGTSIAFEEDLVFRLPVAATGIRVDFADNPNGGHLPISAKIYAERLTLANVGSALAIDEFVGTEPAIYQYSGPLIRTIAFNTPSNLIVIHEIEYTPVPLPSPLWFLALGLIPLGNAWVVSRDVV